MQGGSYPEMATALVLETVITVSGFIRQCTSWRLEREIATDLPEPVLAGSGITAATGTVQWAPVPLDLQGQALTPWTRAASWPPKPGDPVLIDVVLHDSFTTGAKPRSWRVFTGRIQETNGSIADGTLSSTIVDATDLLSRHYQSRPRTYVEPGATDGTWTAVDIGPEAWVSGLIFAAGIDTMRTHTRPGDLPTWRAIPSIDRTTTLELIKKFGQATGSAFFIDEFGGAVWLGRSMLGQGEPVRRLTSRDNLLDLTWIDTRAHARRQVVVRGKDVRIENSDLPRYDVWRGSDPEMDELYRMDIVQSPSNIDFAGVDKRTTRVDDLGPGGKRMFGTRIGAWTQPDNTDGADGQAGFGYRARVTEISWRTWKFEQWIDKIPPKGWHISLDAPTTSGRYKTDLAEQKGKNFPVLRARQKITWTDDHVIGKARGPEWAPDLEVDAGWMLQNDADRQRFADAIASRVASPQPLITDVPIVPDPRLQLGDIVELEDSHRSGITARVVIVGIRFEADPAQLRQLLTCRVLSVVDIDVTLGIVDASWPGYTLGGVDQMLSTRTLGEVDASPLRRS